MDASFETARQWLLLLPVSCPSDTTVTRINEYDGGPTGAGFTRFAFASSPVQRVSFVAYEVGKALTTPGHMYRIGLDRIG